MNDNTTRDNAASVRTPFLLIAWTMPPTATGMSVVSRNLASGFDPDEVVIIGQVLYESRIDLRGAERVQRIRIPDYPIHWRLKPYLEPFYIIPLTVAVGLRAIRQHRLKSVVASFPNSTFLVAGFLISLLARVPFFPYFHNLYVETRQGMISRAMALVIQKVIFWKAKRVLSMSKGMSEYLAKSYHIDSTSLLHPIVQPVPLFSAVRKSTKPYRIAFTGNINNTVVDVIRRVIDAIGEDPDYRIVLHTPVPIDRAKSLIGKWTDIIEIKDVPNQEDLVTSLRSCDVLILALADQHNTILNDDFRTQFPTRTLEMLISERPILVIAPEDYYIARFFRGNGAGKVLSNMSTESIRKAIVNLCTNERERNVCVKNALRIAQEYRIENVTRVLRSELLVS